VVERIMKKRLSLFGMVLMISMLAMPIVSAVQEPQTVPGIGEINPQAITPSAASCSLVSFTSTIESDGEVYRHPVRNPLAYPDMVPIGLSTGDVCLVSMKVLYRGPERSLGMVTVYDVTAGKVIAAKTLPANKVTTFSIPQPFWYKTEGEYEYYIEIWGNGKMSLYGFRNTVLSSGGSILGVERTDEDVEDCPLPRWGPEWASLINKITALFRETRRERNYRKKSDNVGIRGHHRVIRKGSQWLVRHYSPLLFMIG
jgi:hypothetical protein